MNEETSRSSSSAPRLILPLICATAIAVLLLAARDGRFDEIFINGWSGAMNDQLGYVSVARFLVTEGKLQNAVVFPSTLAQKATKEYFYMPGHYLTLAAAIRFFGDRAISFIAPNAIAFVLCSVLTWMIGRRLYGFWAGVAAAALFIASPVNIPLALSAMSEMTLSCALLAVLAVFLFLPVRLRPLVGPLLIALPLFFRETGALVAVPMFFLVLKPEPGPSRWRWRDGAVFGGLALIVFLLVMGTVGRNRPSLLLNSIMVPNSFSAVYTDAFALESVDRSPEGVAAAIKAKAKINMRALLAPLKLSDAPHGSTPDERAGMWFILCGIPIALMVWLLRRDNFALGVLFSLVLIFSLLMLTYQPWSYRGVRVLAITQPLVAILFGAVLGRRIERRNWIAVVLILVLIGMYASQTKAHVESFFRPQLEFQTTDARTARFIETLEHDDRRMIVAPIHLLLRYLDTHHPVRVAFLPANLRTFRLLDQKYDIGTVLYPNTNDPVVVSLAELEAEGFQKVNTTEYYGIPLVVLRRPAGHPAKDFESAQ